MTVRGAKNEFVAFEDVNGVALDQRRGKFDHAGENFVKSIRRTEPDTDFVEYVNV